MRVFRFVALASVLFTTSAEVQAALARTHPSDHPSESEVLKPLNWGDFDGDGLVDLYLHELDAPDRLLHNGGDGQFEDVSATALPSARSRSRIALWRDVDGDEQLDLILVSVTGELQLMHNHGGFFLEGTEVTGIAHETPVVEIRTRDFDADGRLDLELETEAGPSLWHNLGSLAFERVALDDYDPTVRGSLGSVGGNSDSETGAAPFGNSAPTSTTAKNTNAASDIALLPDRVLLIPPVANDLPGAAVPGVTRGSSITPASKTSALTTIGGTRPFKLALGCAESIHDQVTGKCTLVSTTPAMGRIYPLGPEFNIDVTGNVGIGTTTPAAKLDVDGTARFSDTVTLEPSGDVALDVSTGSIYKNGVLFIHTKGGTGNTAIGEQALTTITSGTFTTATGYRALYSSTTGGSNTAHGERALYSNTTGKNNTASGQRALHSNTTGSWNSASGYRALYSNTTGYRNTASGHQALFFNTNGSRNTAIGDRTLYRNTAGSNNTANGYRALLSNTTGSNNTATGDMALFSNTTGLRNVADGAKALFSNTTGNRNTASGNSALFSNTTGFSNTANGYGALSSNVTGYRNTAVGADALILNTLGSRNTATGYRALRSNTIGIHNTACGYNALLANTEGNFNTAGGTSALRSNTTGGSNTAFGRSTISDATSASFNTAFGSYVLTRNLAGYHNTGIGNRALLFNTSGNFNSAMGDETLLNNNVGSFNSAAGSRALRANLSGSFNTACGYQALYANTVGDNNIAVGYKAGRNLTGDDNIAIGNVGVAAESTTIRIGTTATHTRSFHAGIRGVTTDMADAVTVMIDSAGQLGTISSSRRFKQDIRNMGDATERLLKLRPVVFRYKPEVQAGERPTEYGLIAEEVAEVIPELVIFDEDGQPLTVKYHLLSSMLLNELQKVVESQVTHTRELEELRATLVTLQSCGTPEALATNTN